MSNNSFTCSRLIARGYINAEYIKDQKSSQRKIHRLEIDNDKKYKMTISDPRMVDIIEFTHIMFTTSSIDALIKSLKNAKFVITINDHNVFTYYFDLIMKLDPIKIIDNNLIIKIPSKMIMGELLIHSLCNSKIELIIEDHNYEFDEAKIISNEIICCKQILAKKYNVLSSNDNMNDGKNANSMTSVVLGTFLDENINRKKQWESTITHIYQQLIASEEIIVDKLKHIINFEGTGPTKGFFVCGDIDNIQELVFISNGVRYCISHILLRLDCKRITNDLFFYSFDGENDYENRNIESYTNSFNLSRIDSFKIEFNLFKLAGSYRFFSLNLHVMKIQFGKISAII